MTTQAKIILIVRLALGAVLGSALLVVIYAFVIFDPFEWGLVQSEHFTWEKFSSVKKGDDIDRVVAFLGKPVRGPVKIEVLTSDPHDPCFTGDCTKYFFAGARWGASYKEAIVIADKNGFVLLAQAR